jgi:hypothetical protein
VDRWLERRRLSRTLDLDFAMLQQFRRRTGCQRRIGGTER